MKTFRVRIGGVTPHTVEAADKTTVMEKTKERFRDLDLFQRGVEICEFSKDGLTVEDLIKHLQQFHPRLQVIIEDSDRAVKAVTELHTYDGTRSYVSLVTTILPPGIC